MKLVILIACAALLVVPALAGYKYPPHQYPTQQTQQTQYPTQQTQQTQQPTQYPPTKGCCPKIVTGPYGSVIEPFTGHRGNVAIIVDWGTCTVHDKGFT